MPYIAGFKGVSCLAISFHESEAKIYMKLRLKFLKMPLLFAEVGSGALPGLMLDLGLLKISLGAVFSYF